MQPATGGYKTTNGHTAVGINAYLGFPEEGWDGDFGTLIVNAARWLKPGIPCGTATPSATTDTSDRLLKHLATGTPVSHQHTNRNSNRHPSHSY